MATLTRTERAMRSLPCARCGAQPGQRCVSKSGRTTTYDHSARWYAARDAGLFHPEELDAMDDDRMTGAPW